MLHRVIVTREPAGHWNAAFEDAPLTSFSSVRPGVALLSLIQAHPGRAIDLNSIVAMHLEITVDRIVFQVAGEDSLNRDELRAAFRLYE